MEKITRDKEGHGIWANLFNLIDTNVLETDFKGSFEFQHNHEVYWKNLTESIQHSASTKEGSQ